MATNSELKPCPFCKAGETRITPNQAWTGMRYAVNSYTVKHFCAGGRSMISITRNTEAEALAVWNRDSEAHHEE